MAALKILRAGLFTTVQDCGRWGYQAEGVPVSGAMDGYSHRLANRVIGNPLDAATLEVTLMGPHVEFSDAAVFAVAGAHFQLTLNDSPVPMNHKVEAGPGSCLRFGERMRGARAYLAVAGGVDVARVLGSRSTHAVSRMGGHEGRALRAGDVLPVADLAEKGAVPLLPVKGVRPLFSALPEGGARVRVIAGGFSDRIAGRRFLISTQSDRMGYRLEVPNGRVRLQPDHDLSGIAPAELISSPVPTGAIQLPPGGQPILLMADHATAGGYAIAATVISADLPVAGQLAPGDWIEFHACSLEDADEALDAREAALTGSTA